jgi:two-component system LytT family response regulator
MKISIEEIERTLVVNANTIKWLEADENYTNLLLTDGNKLVSTKTLKHYESVLQEKGFFRIHDKYIINLEYVDFHSRGRSIEVTMKCKKVLPVAVRRKYGYLKSIFCKHTYQQNIHTY